MSRRFAIRPSLIMRLSGIGLALLGSSGIATASDDGGLRQFLSDQFGIGTSQAPQPSYGDIDPGDRPLIVRPRHRAAPRVAKVTVGPVAPVSIYNDRTLRPGDAVMTANGIRVFVGGRTAPYSETDFVAISDTSGLPKLLQKELSAIDKVPRT